MRHRHHWIANKTSSRSSRVGVSCRMVISGCFLPPVIPAPIRRAISTGRIWPQMQVIRCLGLCPAAGKHRPNRRLPSIRAPCGPPPPWTGRTSIRWEPETTGRTRVHRAGPSLLASTVSARCNRSSTSRASSHRSKSAAREEMSTIRYPPFRKSGRPWASRSKGRNSLVARSRLTEPLASRSWPSRCYIVPTCRRKEKSHPCGWPCDSLRSQVQATSIAVTRPGPCPRGLAVPTAKSAGGCPC